MTLRNHAAVGAAVLATSLLTATPAEAAPTCQGVPATIVGTKQADVLRGTPRRDVIVGLGGGDDIRGRGGKDLICGNVGADVLRGGGGDDVLAGGWDLRRSGRVGWHLYGDTFRGGPGDDEIRPGDDPRGGDQSLHEDRLVYLGAPVGITVDGAAGTVTGRGGTDTYTVDGPVEIIGSRHDDTFDGGPGADRFRGMAGDDRIHGHGGPDRLFAEDMNEGPEDRDVLRGGGGKDHLEAGPGRDRLHGGPGADRLQDTGGGSDGLFGGTGDDSLADALRHGRRHVLAGGPGRDALWFYSYVNGPDAYPSGRMDLRSGTTRIYTHGIVAKVRDVEIVELPGGSWEFWGTDADEDVTMPAGDPLSMHMGGGDDRVFKAGRGRDFYAGGPGRDEVRDYGGFDRCRSIEVEHGQGVCNG